MHRRNMRHPRTRSWPRRTCRACTVSHTSTGGERRVRHHVLRHIHGLASLVDLRRATKRNRHTGDCGDTTADQRAQHRTSAVSGLAAAWSLFAAQRIDLPAKVRPQPGELRSRPDRARLAVHNSLDVAARSLGRRSSPPGGPSAAKQGSAGHRDESSSPCERWPGDAAGARPCARDAVVETNQPRSMSPVAQDSHSGWGHAGECGDSPMHTDPRRVQAGTECHQSRRMSPTALSLRDCAGRRPTAPARTSHRRQPRLVPYGPAYSASDTTARPAAPTIRRCAPALPARQSPFAQVVIGLISLPAQ